MRLVAADVKTASVRLGCLMATTPLTMRVPKAATAYEHVRPLFGSAGLKIREPIDFSSWNSDHTLRPGQDLFVATKTSTRDSE
jgi:hypothetical protein